MSAPKERAQSLDSTKRDESDQQDAPESSSDVRDLPSKDPSTSENVKGGARTAPAPDWYPF